MQLSNCFLIKLPINRLLAEKISVVILSVVAVLGIMRVSQRVSQNTLYFLFQNQHIAKFRNRTLDNILAPGFNESFPNSDQTPLVSIKRSFKSPNNIVINTKTRARKSTIAAEQKQRDSKKGTPKMRIKVYTRAIVNTNVSESLTTTLTSNPTETLTCNRTEWVYKPVPESSHLCSECPDTLLGYVLENGTLEELSTNSDVILNYPDVQAGGSWEPLNCITQHRVAVIIPYRDRHSHLTVLLAHLHPIMQRQLLKYQIFVVEQKGHFAFNKARIMNIGFSHAMNTSKWDCVIFHDVDLIPENDLNMYACPKQPRHLSPAVDKFGYKNKYAWLVGGVLAITTKHFRKINGYSNMYWVWGAEDDDIALSGRGSYDFQPPWHPSFGVGGITNVGSVGLMHHQNLTVCRPPNSIGRYKMIVHEKRPRYPERITLLNDAITRYQIDGLNSLNSLKWEITAVTNYSSYQHIMVDVGPPPGKSSSFLDD